MWKLAGAIATGRAAGLPRHVRPLRRRQMRGRLVSIPARDRRRGNHPHPARALLARAHTPGGTSRIGIDIDGVRHWRNLLP